MPELQQEEKLSPPAAAVEPTVFNAVRGYIQAHPEEFVSTLGELCLIGADVQLFSDPHARADLLTLDPEGVATVVAVEREGEHSLLEHGLMCAGLVAGWQPSFFFLYPTAPPAAKLRQFLQVSDEQVNRKQRVVLVAHSHDYAIYSAAQWLAQRHGMEIWCVQGRIDPATGRLDLHRLGPASGDQAAEPVGVARVVFPEPSGTAPESALFMGPGLPLAPALEPLTANVQQVCRLQTVWKPDVETAAARSIEGRLQQILDEELRQAGAAVAKAPADTPAAEAPAAGPAAPEAARATEVAAPPAAQPARRPEPAPDELPEVYELDQRKILWAAGIVLISVLGVAAFVALSLRRPAGAPEVDAAAPPAPPAPAIAGGILTNSVQDAANRPIPGARLYYAGQSLLAGPSGEFQIRVVEGERDLLVKAPGYRQVTASIDTKQPIRLEPLDVRGYYLSHSHVADSSRRESILQLIRGTSANAVVMGVKDVTGRLNVEVAHPLAREIGAAGRAQTIALKKHVAAWKAEGIYTVALLALFKDDLLARKKPGLGLKSILSRQPIVDPDGIAWADPASPEVRDYNIAVAKAAAEAGFDEIHFDFIRYPAEAPSDEGGNPAEYERRLATLVGFLRGATQALAPYNVYVSASVFGSVCLMPNPSVIGQKIEEFAAQVDYVAPMLYPSYFEPGQRYSDPLRQSYQLVYENLSRAARRLGGETRKLRPWLQNFPDSASSGESLDAENIRNQVKAAEDARASGWMLWDSRNHYRNTNEALNLLKGDRSRPEPAKRETVSGGSVIPAGGAGGEPPTANPGAPFRLVGLLLLAGCCLGVLYAAVRAAWLFHQWTRRMTPDREPLTAAAEPSPPAWLRRTVSWPVFAGPAFNASFQARYSAPPGAMRSSS